MAATPPHLIAYLVVAVEAPVLVGAFVGAAIEFVFAAIILVSVRHGGLALVRRAA